MVSSNERADVCDGRLHLEEVQPVVDVGVRAHRRAGEVWHHVELHLARLQHEHATQPWNTEGYLAA